MKKIVVIILLIIAIIVGIIAFFHFGIDWLFSEQYNENGISHFLVITVDKEQPKEYLGELEGHRVYIENLNIEETNFRTIDAKNMPIKEALENNLVSIEEWKRYAWKAKTDGDVNFLQFENYEIVITNEECIIRPFSR